MNFYQEFKQLVLSKPNNALVTRSCQHTAFSNYLYRCKNIYLSHFCVDAEDCFYSDHLTKSRDCVDCNYLTSCELCYECHDCTNLYNCSFMQDCHKCSNSNFCLDCNDCKDCFACFGLRRQQYRVFNKQYSEPEYRAKVAQLTKNPPLKILEILRPEFTKYPRSNLHLLKTGSKIVGDYIYYGNHCYLCFDVQNIEACSYVCSVRDPERVSAGSFDCDLGFDLNDCYDCMDVNKCQNCSFMAHSLDCLDCEYMINCANCRNCYGCAYLENKEYCILNRQFTRDEYLAAVKIIKAELKASAAYGKPLADVLK